jgi:putative spermidine/putrescine transport system substrate-binding protein
MSDTTSSGPSRRHLLVGGAAAGAALPFLPGLARAQASGRCVVSTWAGDYGNLLTKNIEQPILAPKGIEVVQDGGTEPVRTAKMIAQQRLPRGTIDVIALQAHTANDMNEAGLLEPLDAEKVPNIKYILPELTSPFSIPHIFSPQVLAYNPERVPDPPKTFTDLQADKYKGKVGFLDQSFAWFLMAAALKLKGDPSKTDEVKPVIEKMIREGDHAYPSTEAFAPAIRSGEIDVGMVWQARVVFWQQAGVPIKATFPTEGCVTYVSSLAIPKNAPNKPAAYAYLNAALDPAAQRGFAATMGYLPTVTNAPLEGEVAQRLALPEPRPKLMQADYVKLSATRDELNDWWKRLLSGR